MEKHPPGVNWLADFTNELSRWIYLAGQFFETHHGVFATISIALMASITVAILYYLLPKARLVQSMAVTLAVAAGMAFILQALLAVSVPKLYESYGRGHVANCQVFERDADGNYIYDPVPVTVEGEEKIAMVARKIIYQVESPVYVAMDDGRETLGFLITPVANAGRLPSYCGLPFNDDARALIENINMQQTPVDIELIRKALLMKENGFLAFSLLTNQSLLSRNADGHNYGVLMMMQHLANQLSAEDIQPMTVEDLLYVLDESAKNTPHHPRLAVRGMMRQFIKEALMDVGVDENDAGRMALDWIVKIGNFNSNASNVLSGARDAASTIPDDMAYDALIKYGLTREALIDILNVVRERMSLYYSGIYARRVAAYLLEAKLHERKPLITLPGEPRYYLIDPGDGQDQGQQGNSQQGQPQELEQALEGNEAGRMSSERFGQRQNHQESGTKDDGDRS